MMRLNLLALPLLAALAIPMNAHAWGGWFNHGGCESGNCGSGGCGHGALANHPPTYCQHNGHGFCQPPFQAAPWYLYWPYDAHFQMPAPIAAPYIAPQGFNTPWNPYFPAPAGPMPAGYPGAFPAAPVAPPAGAPHFGPAN